MTAGLSRKDLACWGRPTCSSIRAASAANLRSARTLWKLYVYETLLKWLPQHFQDVAADLWSCIQQAHPMVRQRHVARPRHLPPTDPPYIGDRVVRGATRPRGDQGGAGAGAAGDARDAGGVEGFGEGHRGQDGGQPAGQPRLPRSGWTQEEHILGTTPA